MLVETNHDYVLNAVAKKKANADDTAKFTQEVYDRREDLEATFSDTKASLKSSIGEINRLKDRQAREVVKAKEELEEAYDAYFPASDKSKDARDAADKKYLQNILNAEKALAREEGVVSDYESQLAELNIQLVRTEKILARLQKTVKATATITEEQA